MKHDATFTCGRVRSFENEFIHLAEFRLRRMRTPFHAHDRSALAVGIAGNLEIEVGRGPPTVLAVGSLFPMPAGLDHREVARDRQARCLLVACDLPAVDQLEPHVLCTPTVAILGELLLEALESDDRLGLEATACELVALAELDLARRSVRLDSPPWVDRIAEYLDDSFRRPPALARLAEEAGVSREHLARVFRRTTGLTVGQYVRKRRALESAARLRAGRADLSEVALACGFADQSHFTREFRRYFRTTPRRYHLVVGSG